MSSAPETKGEEPTPTSGWRTIARMARPRATRANLFALLLAALLGFAIATQVRSTQDQGLENLRQDELVRILDDVSQNGSRLEDEASELERTRDALAEGDGSDEAVAAARERADTLAILAGTAPATGPGIVLTIEDPQGRIDAAALLDTVQELRDAGAEAMQIGDVRVVAATSFTNADGGVAIGPGDRGTVVKAPFVLKVIGDPRTMASAMEIPGGVAETVRGRGGDAQVQESQGVDVTALHTVSAPQYAQPVPEPDGTERPDDS